MAERGPVQLNIPRDHFYGEFDAQIAAAQRIERGPGGAKSSGRTAEILAAAEFPVIMVGGGDHVRGRGAGPRAGRVHAGAGRH